MPKSWTIGADTTRAKKKAETHRRILDAAAELFETKGFYETTTAQIAKAAGVSPGSIYAHFGSPENIMAEMHRQFVFSRAKRLTTIRESWPTDKSAWELLLFMLDEVWGMNKSTLQMENVSAYHSWLWVCDPKDFTPLRDTYREVFSELAQAIERAQAEGTVPVQIEVPAMVEIMAAIFFQGIQEARTGEAAFYDQYQVLIGRVHQLFGVKQHGLHAGAA